MATSEDLIDFDVIEQQKENIQSLPGGRSAKKLADLYSPSPLHKLSTPTPSDTKNVNDCIRAEYEAEVQAMSESDDPLDVFDRYVRWTLDAYPSAQATPQSQLHLLLERATKAFISSAQYKNDPRYLKLWVHYIHFFSDAPRETYVFLSRHGIGEGLALFYEEYAEWLEGHGKWAQAEEVYKLGIEREARPVQRLLRKFKEFEGRMQGQDVAGREPGSPALPTVRPALAAKMDPFGGASRAADSQASRQQAGASKPAKSKLAIFSDADSKPPAMSSMEAGSKGWDTIGSMKDRKKENTMEPKPWAGETLRAGGKKTTAPKMSVFRDANVVVVPSKNQITRHPQTGKKECIFVDLAAVYPTPEEPGTELSFEEIMAANRGWLDCSWEEENVDESLVAEPVAELDDAMDITSDVAVVQEKLVVHEDRLVVHQDKLVIHQDVPLLDENGAPQQPEKPRSHKKKKLMEVNETQIIKAKLDSPSGPKLKKKNTSEPTMTIHTRAATDDIYEIFNAPLKRKYEDDSAEEDNYDTDGDYTTDNESTGTRQVEAEAEAEASEHGDDETSDAKSLSEWSDFSTRKHVPHVDVAMGGDEQGDTHVSDLIDTSIPEEASGSTTSLEREPLAEDVEEVEELETPILEDPPTVTRTTFVPIPPEDYEPRVRPFRDPVEVANNRLPFMTPITERTESSLELTETHLKTPCRRDDGGQVVDDDEDLDLEAFSSPLREIVNGESPRKTPGERSAKKAIPFVKPKPKPTAAPAKVIPKKGPIIKDLQCNPVDESVRNEILANIQPPLSGYTGFYDHREETYGHGNDIRKYAKALMKANKPASERTSPIPPPAVVEFADTPATYSLKRELGAGAFAPVYLVENSAPQGDENDENAVAMGKGIFAVSHRAGLEALKMESPPTPWEFYMMRTAHSRLGPQHRATASLSYAHEMHLYRDEAFLFLPYHPHGTLLDVVNFFRAEPAGVMDESLAMFFTIELMRTVEALHAKNVMHGDIKPDNCLLRIDSSSTSPSMNPGEAESEPLIPQYHADGSGGWSSRGVTLIDFGRGIDMRAFTPDVAFFADWKTTAQDCAEMREGRPWTWQIDYHGLAGTIHCLLFGKYIETTRCDTANVPGQLGGGIMGRGLTRRYRIREGLKRYWQGELWGECFDLLLNPASNLSSSSEPRDGEKDEKMSLLKGMRSVREKMEKWLEGNCERGVGLKGVMARLEAHAAKSRRWFV